jgi:hypothetical protein
MQPTSTPSIQARVERVLANLKIVSRLLGHELHVQNGQRIVLSREEVAEIQTSLDLFIEELSMQRRQHGQLATVAAEPAPARMN